MLNRIFCFFLITIIVCACEKNIDPAVIANQYPPEIEKIIINKCAVSGCHNNRSFQNAANLNLTTWNTLMEGGVNGSCVIPFQPSFSSLFQFINTYDSIGIVAYPTMPINNTALSLAEVKTMKKWIEDGCPNTSGKIPFEEELIVQKKIYITNQGCDVVSIVNTSNNLVARYISVGGDKQKIESPHTLKVSPDGRYWYVCFATGKYFQKFDSKNDELIAQVEIGEGSWNVVSISNDGLSAYISDLNSNGKVVKVNTSSMQVTATYMANGILSYPHGIAISSTGDTLYFTGQYGNTLYRFIPSIPHIDLISLQKNVAPHTIPNTLDPHEIITSPDGSKYFLTCQSSNEVVVIQAGVDTVLSSIPVGIYPLEMSISKKRNKIYVVCQEDPNPLNPFYKGGVYEIDINTLKVTNIIYANFFNLMA
ncbi:MAG: YncE family protein [Chitinophagaceae bacterium]